MSSALPKSEQHSTRIAYFAGTMKPGHDGVTRVLYRLIDSLRDRRIANVFYSALIPLIGQRPTEMFEVPSVRIPMYRGHRFALPGQKYFEDHLASFKPDLIHINSPCPLGYAAVQYGRMHRIPVVATYHTHFVSYANYYKVSPLELLGWNYMRKLYNSCQRVYVPSVPIVNELGGHGIGNLKFLPHGVDTTVFHPQFRSRTWKEELGIGGKSVLLFVGRLVWEKDLRTLAEAYRILSARRSDVVCVLVGDGPIHEELRQLMPGAVFLGYKSGHGLSTAYASSDLFVFPSTTETFGNVTVEAMASGLVPVCAREGGAHGSIQPGVTGLLTEPRDAADLVEKIEYLLDRPGKRAEMADQALRYARCQTWDRIFDDLFADYEELLRDFIHLQPAKRRKAA